MTYSDFDSLIAKYHMDELSKFYEWKLLYNLPDYIRNNSDRYNVYHDIIGNEKHFLAVGYDSWGDENYYFFIDES